MAVDLSAVAPEDGAFSATRRVAMDATAGNVVAVTLPRDVNKVTQAYKAADGTTDAGGAFALTGADGAAQVADAFPVASGGAYERQVAPGRARPGASVVLYLSCDTNSGYCFLDLEY